MKIYRIMLSVEGFDLDSGGGPFDGGAVKNEYVLAQSQDDAIAKAKKRILQALPRAEWVINWDPSSVKFSVDEVETSWDFRWLLRHEGFAFHPIHEPSP